MSGFQHSGSGIEHWSADLSARMVGHAGVRVVFHHLGQLDPAKLEDLLAAAETSSKQANDGVRIRKRLYNVLVEGLDNMHLHAEDHLRESSFALLVEEEGGYRSIMGNALPAATAALISHRVSVLNEMSETDLKEHFMKLLANDGRTENGGAGLGLVTMARKTARPIIAHLLPKDADTAYFALELNLPRI